MFTLAPISKQFYFLIYIYITETLEAPTIFHIIIIFKYQYYKTKILILITISPRYSFFFLIKTRSTLSPLPLYHKRSTIQNQIKTVNVSTYPNQKFHQLFLLPSSSISQAQHQWRSQEFIFGGGPCINFFFCVYEMSNSNIQYFITEYV